MLLTKTTTVDQITVTKNGIVLYREATRIVEDGNRISIQLNSPQRLKTIPSNLSLPVGSS
jgi:hypothetical protein